MKDFLRSRARLMFMTFVLGIIAGCVTYAPAAHAWPGRNSAERYAFAHEHACPQVKPHRASACPGYVVDHVVPLCAGGVDDRTNMQWQGNRDAVYKDREEERMCRMIRQGKLKSSPNPKSYCAGLPIAQFPRMRRDFKCDP